MMRFGTYEVDLRLGELRKNAISRQAQNKVELLWPKENASTRVGNKCLMAPGV